LIKVCRIPNERNPISGASLNIGLIIFQFGNKFKYIEKGTLLQFIDYQEFERVEFLLNCPYCNDEIVYEDATFVQNVENHLLLKVR